MPMSSGTLVVRQWCGSASAGQLNVPPEKSPWVTSKRISTESKSA